MPVRKKNDALLKGAFEDYFPDLLRFFYEEADKIFDMGKGFVFMDKELRELYPDPVQAGGGRESDLLVKVHLRDGREKWLLVHCEIEGGGKKDFPFRMFQYHYRLLDRFRTDVASLVVFTYLSYHIFDHSREELLSMEGNPFALVVLAAQKVALADKLPEEELGEERSTIARAFIGSGRYGKEDIDRFMFFLRNFVFIGNKEINRNFEHEVLKLTGGNSNMGIIEAVMEQRIQEGKLEGEKKGKLEGEKKGKLEGERKGKLEGERKGKLETARRLLTMGLSVSQIAQATDLPVEEIEKLK